MSVPHTLAARLGLFAFARRLLARRRLFILELHGTPTAGAWHLSPEGAWHRGGRHRDSGTDNGTDIAKGADLPPALRPTITADDLHQLLTWATARLRFITPDQAFEPPVPGTEDPRPTALLTFDDGLANHLHGALPVLRRHGVPALFFVATRHLADSGHWLPPIAEAVEGLPHPPSAELAQDLFDGLGDDGLRRLAADPLVTIGAHSVHHPRLSQLSDDELARELTESRQYLQRLIDAPVDYLAYPFGDFDERVAHAAAGAGYRAAFAEDALDLARQHPSLAPFDLGRIGLYSADPDYLDAKLSGLHRPALRRPLPRRGSPHAATDRDSETTS